MVFSTTTPYGREIMSDGLTKLALMHDSEDMIGLTRSFVDDIKSGLSLL